MESRNRSERSSALRPTSRRLASFLGFSGSVAVAGILAVVGLIGTSALSSASTLTAQADPPPVPPPTCVACPEGYHCGHNPERCIPDKKSPKAAMTTMHRDRQLTPVPQRVTQNANWVACYKDDKDMKRVRFRWCPKNKPWTATNETRNFCYATSEACARSEMPQSWCIKCEGSR